MIRKTLSSMGFVLLSLIPVHGSCGGFGITCSVSAPGINFGTYNTVNTINLPASDLTVSCTGLFGTVAPTVQLSSGSGTYANRIMNGPTGNSLSYNLYTNSSYTTVFGDGTQGTGDYVGASQPIFFSQVNYNVPIYAQLPGGQNVAPGSYATTQPITVTVTY
ncbi:spore coat protein U domain-containing protein [Acidithiobacillus concretivorus]|uniref:Spore coat protein U domain-containing protein n=1 Tax=Acidithiobacillus concretivorus TaxID=3063952 RepID=A0ABS5ZSI0_9PROT|nr:spore coat protein U domain-containing protein [Acidithiobacillus concretivorus]MBU2739425.1 spore coat protein U domain-containing protein [Acidithiobacillus concretivorus]